LIFDICFYTNFSTPYPIKVLALPLTFNLTLSLKFEPLKLCTLKVSILIIIVNSCNVYVFHFCIWSFKLNLFKATCFINHLEIIRLGWRGVPGTKSLAVLTCFITSGRGQQRGNCRKIKSSITDVDELLELPTVRHRRHLLPML
jgi:hypothetical protein